MRTKKQKILKPRYWNDFNVSLSELARLFGRSSGAVVCWVKFKGLPRNSDGSFNLRNSIRWVENYYAECAKITVKVWAVNQNQLAQLLGISRQRIHDFVQAGMPDDGNGRYDLLVVLRWLLRYFEDFYRKKYRKRKTESQPVVKRLWRKKKSNVN